MTATPNWWDETLLRRTARNALSGTVGGVAVSTVGHPFDTLKVRLQTQSVTSPTYNGFIDCFKKTLQWEGVGGFYKGVASPLLGQMYYRAIMFTAYHQFSSFLQATHAPGERIYLHEVFLAGAATGGVSAFVESPIDLFKTKMQIQVMRIKAGEPRIYRHALHAGYLILKAQGIRGAYQGLSATITRNIPARGFCFFFYEMVRNMLTPEGKTVNDLNTGHLLVAGGAGGFAYWSLTYPLDVMKSAMMSDASDKSARRYHGLVDCGVKLYRDEGGYKRFLVGIKPCLLISIPANAAMLMVVEQCRKYIFV